MNADTQTDTDEGNNHPQVGIVEAFQTIPLFDEPYLSMQVMNLHVVDNFLEDQETDLLNQYMETERTPLQTTIFVSALSQMWIFALYELLRTWRQRTRNILQWAKDFGATPGHERTARLAAKKHQVEARAADPRGAVILYWPAYEQAAVDPLFADSLRKAFDRSERLFRRIEALRMSLAKHEIPRMTGSYALTPGYGRIDMMTGSIYWQVVLVGDEVDIISRRDIADDCRRLALNYEIAILPERIQQKIKNLPDHSYGVKRITVITDDGTVHTGVYVAWGKEIIRVENEETVRFDVNRIVEARQD